MLLLLPVKHTTRTHSGPPSTGIDTVLFVCEVKTSPHKTAALILMRARIGGARSHDYWQQASKRGVAKELRFWGLSMGLSPQLFRPDGLPLGLGNSEPIARSAAPITDNGLLILGIYFEPV